MLVLMLVLMLAIRNVPNLWSWDAMSVSLCVGYG